MKIVKEGQREKKLCNSCGETEHLKLCAACSLANYCSTCVLRALIVDLCVAANVNARHGSSTNAFAPAYHLDLRLLRRACVRMWSNCCSIIDRYVALADTCNVTLLCR